MTEEQSLVRDLRDPNVFNRAVMLRAADALEAVTAERDRLKAAIEQAKASEERTHKALTSRKPKREDSSQTWRILSAALNEGKNDE